MKEKKVIKMNIIDIGETRSDCFGYISVKSEGSYDLVIDCFYTRINLEQSQFRFVFKGFHGFSNNEEFFSPNEIAIFEYKENSSGNNSPISWVSFNGFKNYLSDYNSICCNENTKLWRFLSIDNIVTVYSDSEPEFKKIKAKE